MHLPDNGIICLVDKVNCRHALQKGFGDIYIYIYIYAI